MNEKFKKLIEIPNMYNMLIWKVGNDKFGRCLE